MQIDVAGLCPVLVEAAPTGSQAQKKKGKKRPTTAGFFLSPYLLLRRPAGKFPQGKLPRKKMDLGRTTRQMPHANRRALCPPQWRNRASRVCSTPSAAWPGPGKLHFTSNRRRYLARYRRTAVHKLSLQLGGLMLLAGPFAFADPVLVPDAFIQQHTATSTAHAMSVSSPHSSFWNAPFDERFVL